MYISRVSKEVCYVCGRYFYKDIFYRNDWFLSNIKKFSTAVRSDVNYEECDESKKPFDYDKITESNSLQTNQLKTKKSYLALNYIESLRIKKKVKNVIISALQEKERGSPSIYLVDKNAAKLISDKIAPEVKNSDSLFIEGNPGPGFLTKELIKAGINNIRLYEPNKIFFNHLNEEDFPLSVEIFDNDIMRYWNSQFIDSKDGGERLAKIFSGINIRNWEDEPFVTVFGVTIDKKFMLSIIKNIVTRTGFLKYGRPEFYLLIDSITYSILTLPGTQGYQFYRSYSVLFQIIFDYEVLLELPRKVLVPWWKSYSNATTHKLSKDNEATMYLVKITPRRDLFANDFDKNLSLFNYFLKQLFSSRSKRVIIPLEQWAPGCGPNFIAMGYSIYTEAGELTPKELLNLFLNFISWEEFTKSSVFFSSMDSYYLKKDYSDNAIAIDD